MAHLKKSRLTTIALTMAATLGVAACTSSESTTETSSTPTQVSPPASSQGGASTEPTGPAIPQVGECRNMTTADIPKPSNSDPIVDCSQPHTTMTYAVGQMPGGYKSTDVGLPEAEREKAADLCTARHQEVLATGPDMYLPTRLRFSWFYPTAAERRQGASWVRCDLSLTDGDKLLPMPDVPVPTNAATIAPELRQCLPTPKSKSADGVEVIPCTEPHQSEAFAQVRVGEPDEPWPGEQEVRERGWQYCTEIYADEINPDDRTFDNLIISYDRRGDWGEGEKFAICWVDSLEKTTQLYTPTLQPTPSPEVKAATPQVGDCRNLTLAQVGKVYDSVSAIPCRQTHTAYTYLVDNVEGGYGPFQDGIFPKRLWEHLNQTCASTLNARFTVNGDDLAPTMLVARLKFPTPEQRQHGATWFACDMHTIADGVTRLYPLPQNSKQLSGDRAPQSIQGCMTETRQGKAVLVPCSKPHSLRMIAFRALAGQGRSWPGEEKVSSWSERECRAAAKRYARKTGGGAPDFSWTSIDADTWEEGQRHVLCWVQTTR